jgi:hypothetical protein
MDIGRCRDAAGGDGGIETAEVGAMGGPDHQAGPSPLRCQLADQCLMNGRSNISAASPTGPAGSDTAGPAAFLVMKIPFREVLS